MKKRKNQDNESRGLPPWSGTGILSQTELRKDLDRIREMDYGSMVMLGVEKFGVVLESKYDSLTRKKLSYLFQDKWYADNNVPMSARTREQSEKTRALTDDEWEHDWMFSYYHPNGPAGKRSSDNQNRKEGKMPKTKKEEPTARKTIASFAIGLLKSEKDIKPDDMVKRVQKEFPGCKFNAKHVSWYKSNMKKKKV